MDNVARWTFRRLVTHAAAICRSPTRWWARARSTSCWFRRTCRTSSCSGSCRPTRGFLERLSSFSRLILFERRGSGMSDGIAGATPLEEQIDDVQAVIDAVGSEQPVLISYLEGCGLTALFAASHPDLVRALVLLSPQPRLVAGPGYEWAPSVEQRAAIVQAIVESWGTDSPANPLAALVAGRGRPAAKPDGALTASGDESCCRCRVAGDDRRDGCAWRASQRAVPDAGAAP